MKFTTIAILSMTAGALAAPHHEGPELGASSPATKLARDQVKTAAANLDKVLKARYDPIDKRSPDPWCTKRGWAFCKRDVDVEPPHDFEARSNAPGGAAFFAKRAVDRLALAVAGAQVDPRDYYANLGLEARFAPDTAARAIQARELTPEAHELDKRWCTKRGWAFCRRAIDAADAVLNATEADDDYYYYGPQKRSPEPEPWCTKRGWAFCKRDVETPFDPVARVKRSPEPWCTKRGWAFCKRATPEEQDAAQDDAECHAPDGECTKANNHVLAMRSAAKEILDYFN